MERTASGRDRDELSGSGQRAADRADGSANGRFSPIDALHRAVGNQAVQTSRATSGGTDQSADRSADSAGPVPELCSRCGERYRAGKPLDCSDCEAKLHRRSTAPTERGGGHGTVRPKLAVSAPDTPAEREADRVAGAVVESSEPDSTDARADGGPDAAIRRREDDASGSELDGERERQIQSATRGGRPLPTSERSFFEVQFDRDFTDVRVHTGSDADRAARSIDAAAFTLGPDIAFARGNYRPGTAAGRHLLAHELTHVVQQGGVGRSVRRMPSKTDHGRSYNKGVKHDHRPSGQWSEIQERADCNLVGEKSVWNTIRGSGVGPVGCVCSWYQPREVLQTAIDQRMGDKPLARRHMDRYMNGGGDLEEDVRSVVLDDPGVTEKLESAIANDGDRGHFKIEQSHYENDDFWFSFGAIDRFDYEVDRGAGEVHVWFADRYEWHPVYDGLYDKKSGDEERPTNCVHAAAVELKNESAADYWMYGHDTVPLDRLPTGGSSSGSGSGGSGGGSGDRSVDW